MSSTNVQALVERTQSNGVVTASDDVLSSVTTIVSAYVSNNSLRMEDLTCLVAEVYARIWSLVHPLEKALINTKPAVSIKESVQPDFLISLIDGKKYKTLKRHLMEQHGMTPGEYRAHFRLPSDYPMVAPNLSAQRSRTAKRLTTGQK